MPLRTREKLATELYSAFWRDLKTHAMQDALFLVGPTVDLLDAGVAVADNQTSRVQNWITAGYLTRPTHEQIAAWKPGKIFASLIVQPYVLVQETDAPEVDVPPAEGMSWDELIRFLRRP